MTLAELITALEAANPDRVVPHGFTNPHSYRGYYHELAFEPAANVTVAAMLDDARSALYATYQGWKGGDFTMSDTTDCWLSMEGCASGDTISALLLELMLAEPSPAPDEALPVTTSPMSQPEPLTEQQLDEIDTLPAWLYQRFMAGGVGWENLGADDRAYWEHQARAVRRAVARGGFKTASEATSAPLAASQPPEAPVEGETATRAAAPLLDRAEQYLSVQHTHQARHDNLGANYGCAGCELRDAIRKQQADAIEEATR